MFFSTFFSLAVYQTLCPTDIYTFFILVHLHARKFAEILNDGLVNIFANAHTLHTTQIIR